MIESKALRVFCLCRDLSVKRMQHYNGQLCQFLDLYHTAYQILLTLFKVLLTSSCGTAIQYFGFVQTPCIFKLSINTIWEYGNVGGGGRTGPSFIGME